MSLALLESLPKSRLKALLDHFSVIDDPRQRWKVVRPLSEVLLLVVRGTICDYDSHAAISAWGARHTCPFCVAFRPIIGSCLASSG